MKKKVSSGIYKVSDGAYQISWYEQGTRRWETVHISSIKEARDIRNKKIIDAKKAKDSPVDANRDASLEDIWSAIEGHCRAVGNTDKTIGEYKKRYGRLFNEFPLANGLNINRPNDLTEAHLNRYVAWYVNGYKSKVKIKQNPASEVNTIKIILGKLKKLGYLDKDIHGEIKGFVKLQDNEDENYPNISNTDLKKMFNYMGKDDPSYHDFFTSLLWTGRRPMETAKILKERVVWRGINDPERINIQSPTAKNRRKDHIILHAMKDIDLKAAIVNAFNRANLLNSPYLFCNRFGRQISSSNQEVYIKKVSKAVLGFQISARYFRKRYATMCGLYRVPIKDAMSRSGHRDVGIFVKHYQQPTQDGIGAVIDAIGLDGKGVDAVAAISDAVGLPGVE